MMSPPPPTSIANRQDPSDLAISPKHQLTTQISAISPVVQWRDVIVAQRQLTERHFCEQEISGPPKLFGPFCFFHIAPSNLAAICPCLAFSAQLDLSFGRLWNLDVEWNRHDCDPATFDLMTWRLWSWSTWNYAPRRFQILNMVWESDVENSAWNRSLGGAWLWGRGLEFEPPPCSGHPALACIYHPALLGENYLSSSMHSNIWDHVKSCQSFETNLRQHPALGCLYHLALYAFQLLRHIKSGLCFEINLDNTQFKIINSKYWWNEGLKHTSYLSFFLHGQNFWRIKFTLKNANFSR